MSHQSSFNSFYQSKMLCISTPWMHALQKATWKQIASNLTWMCLYFVYQIQHGCALFSNQNKGTASNLILVMTIKQCLNSHYMTFQCWGGKDMTCEGKEKQITTRREHVSMEHKNNKKASHQKKFMSSMRVSEEGI